MTNSICTLVSKDLRAQAMAEYEQKYNKYLDMQAENINDPKIEELEMNEYQPLETTNPPPEMAKDNEIDETQEMKKSIEKIGTPESNKKSIEWS